MPQIKAIALFIIIALLCGACGPNQEKSDMNALENFFPSKFENYAAADTLELYDYDGIFRYIDGAGEVYRMYDYRQVAMQKYSAPDLPDITLEIFDMGKPEDAFGIFLHSASGHDVQIGSGSSLSGGYLLFWQNRYFVSIYLAVNLSELDSVLLTLGKLVAKNLPQGGMPPEIINYLPADNQAPNSLRFFHTHIALNYQYYLSPDNILALNDSTDAVLARFNDNQMFAVLIRYENEDNAKSAVESFISSYIPEADDSRLLEISPGKFSAIKQHNNFAVVIFDAPSPEDCKQLFLQITTLLPQ